ncbi:hypothetical protein AQ505_07980 [Pedobacter sp. PACM 27299]|uniref:hypothetical protein n=1 Tax=Pedobacter sp. PACM 27299 TaxID=1727164 RepID=UPI0007057865|nr:hypothetical protein [Pedobacter sp. PACM 27299]ALL05433.1 hypothetical protein AQ505_07980 [Pedobacter sp. PACM 27299]
MSNITPNPVLEHVVNVIKNVISDIKIEYTSTNVANLKDGNAPIYLEQHLDESGKLAIFIKDPKDIIFSEDLLPELNSLDEGVKGALKSELQAATIIINDLNVATQIIFQSAKDAFDQISNSYEFAKNMEKDITKVKSTFKFGSNVFDLTILNEPELISITPEFAASFNPAIKKTVEDDARKVQNALNAMFK